MLKRLLLSSQAKQFSSFVSPAFFDVLPARKLWNRAKALRATSRDDEARRRALKERAATLERSDLSVSVTASAKGEPEVGARDRAMPATRRAAEVVALYFHQIFAGNLLLFDLRARSFTAGRDRLLWHPSGWITRLSSDFIEPLRAVYRGFYEEDDAHFRKGLDALELKHAEDVFRKHFGAGQDAVRFRTRDFVATFHEVFVRCRDEKTKLHEDFLPLGLYLATLYDHLEDLAVEVDVREGYRRGARIAKED